jgi:hypothetical protein
VLATGKVVGLGSCCRTGLVNFAPKPFLGEREALGRLTSLGIHAGGGSVCARNGESCRAGVLLPHWNGARCSKTVPGLTGVTGTPRLLPEPRRWRFGVRELATEKVVGLGSCCRSGLVNVPPKPCLWRTGGTGTHRLLRDSRRCRFGVCSQRKRCRAGVLLPHLTHGRFSRTLPWRSGGTGTPRLLRDSRRWRFGVCSQREKLSG